MSNFSGNGATGYRVVYSAAVLQMAKRLRNRLSGPEAQGRMAAALRAIHGRLRSDPLVFGEHRHQLPNLQLMIRAAAIRPLFVSYGVHIERPLVFVREFQLLPSRD